MECRRAVLGVCFVFNLVKGDIDSEVLLCNLNSCIPVKFFYFHLVSSAIESDCSAWFCCNLVFQRIFRYKEGFVAYDNCLINMLSKISHFATNRLTNEFSSKFVHYENCFLSMQ